MRCAVCCFVFELELSLGLVSKFAIGLAELVFEGFMHHFVTLVLVVYIHSFGDCWLGMYMN